MTPDRTCPQCGTTFTPKSRRVVFCSPAHAKAFHNLDLARASALMPLLQAWRAGKHGASPEVTRFGFKEACALLDRYNAEDRAAGRRASLLVAEKLEAGWRASDLAPRQSPAPDPWLDRGRSSARSGA